MDIMLEGILRMPYEMAMSNEMSRYQYYSRAQQALEEITKLRAEVEALRKDAERYMFMRSSDFTEIYSSWVEDVLTDEVCDYSDFDKAIDDAIKAISNG